MLDFSITALTLALLNTYWLIQIKVSNTEGRRAASMRFSAVALTFIVDAAVGILVSGQECLHLLFCHFLTFKFNIDLHLRPR